MCADPSDRIDVKSVSNGSGNALKPKTIELTCDDQDPLALELLAGEGTVINDGTEFTGVLSINTRGPSDRTPRIDLNVNSAADKGQIEIDNAWSIEGVYVGSQTERPVSG